MSHARSVESRIYLDNAATSWPKPEGVYAAVDEYMRSNGAAAGRSGYAEAVAASRAVDAARRKIAALVGLNDPSHLVFTANGTDSLNLVIHGLLRSGDHIITSVVEHNSVLRPLGELEAAGMITVTAVGCNAAGVIDPDEVRQAIRPATRLIALTHASNVTGAIQPVKEVARIARESGVLVLCDAAQTIGHLPIEMERLEVDFIAAPGHKGLLGPLGTGILAMRPEAAAKLRSVRQGGTGTQSEETRQPNVIPQKFEAGNLNVPGIVGLAAAADFFLRGSPVGELCRRGAELTDMLLEGLLSIPKLRVFGPATAEGRVPLVSVTLEGYDPQEVAVILDATHRIQVRPGLHCAPLMHQALGTHVSGGTVRLSLGAFTTSAHVEIAIEGLREIAGERA